MIVLKTPLDLLKELLIDFKPNIARLIITECTL